MLSSVTASAREGQICLLDMPKADEAGIPEVALHVFKCNDASADRPLSLKCDDASVDHPLVLYSGSLIWELKGLNKGSSIPSSPFMPLVVQGILPLILWSLIIIQPSIYSLVHYLPTYLSVYSISSTIQLISAPQYTHLFHYWALGSCQPLFLGGVAIRISHTWLLPSWGLDSNERSRRQEFTNIC